MRRAALERAAVALFWAGRALYHVPGRERDARAVPEGTMSSSEIESVLADYAKMRRRFQSGKPIGYLIFN